MNSEFKLWPVGQGLFYSGNIDEKFNFIYDCGGDIPYIDIAVDKYISEMKINELDMLIISHFDEDHINGLPRLFSRVKKISKIFIPYYGGISTYLLLLTYMYIYDVNLLDTDSEIIFVDTDLEGERDREEFIGVFGDNLTETYNIDDKFKTDNIKLSRLRRQVVKFKDLWKFKFYNTYLKKGISSFDIVKEIKNIMNNY